MAYAASACALLFAAWGLGWVKSLLPIGVLAVEGEFERGEVVGCFDGHGREVARGLVN